MYSPTLIITCAMCLTGIAQADDFKSELSGDVGIGDYYTRSLVTGNQNTLNVMPYLDIEYDRLFARVDTFGIKTSKLGYGYLELVGRISQDATQSGIGKRENSIPLGIGTLQETPLGGIMINAFHDINQSQGNLFEAIYGGQINLPGVTFYPMAGLEYQSKQYVRYYYGVSPQEAASSQYAAYQPAGAVNSLAGLIADIPLGDAYHLNLNLRRKWLDHSIQSSPIVNRNYQDTAYMSLSYRFK